MSTGHRFSLELLSVCVVVAMKEHVRPAAALWCALIVCVVIIGDEQFPPTLHADVMNSEPQNISNIYCGADKKLLGEAAEYSGQRSVMRWIQVKHIFPLFNFWILISREQQQQEIKQALTNLKCVFLTVLQLRRVYVCVRMREKFQKCLVIKTHLNAQTLLCSSQPPA